MQILMLLSIESILNCVLMWLTKWKRSFRDGSLKNNLLKWNFQNLVGRPPLFDVWVPSVSCGELPTDSNSQRNCTSFVILTQWFISGSALKNPEEHRCLHLHVLVKIWGRNKTNKAIITTNSCAFFYYPLSQLNEKIKLNIQKSWNLPKYIWF